MKPSDFVSTYGPLAGDIAEQTGLAPQTILGIVAQETGWGDHHVGNNIFGISPDGPRGQYVARYPTIQDASQAFIDLIKRKYPDAAKGETPEQQVGLIAGGGYNKTANYPSSIIKHIALMRTLDQATPPAANDDAALLAKINTVAPPNAQGAPAAGGAPNRITLDVRPEPDDAAATAALRAKMDAIAPPQETKPPATGGIKRNIAAGAVEGGEGGINFISDPIGSLGQMALSGGASAYDALAPYVGLSRMTPAARRFITGADDAELQPGNRLAAFVGSQMAPGPSPSDVTSDTTAERLLRAGTAGAVAGTVMPNALLGPLSGAAGSIAGEEGARLAPEWAQPGVQLLGNVLGGGIVYGAPAAYNALKGLSQGGISLPAGVSPLSPQAAAFYDAQRAARGGGGAPPATPPPAPEPNLLQGMPPVAPEVAAKIGERSVAPSEPIPATETPVPPVNAAPSTAAPITTAAQAKAHASGIYKALEGAGGELTPEFANKFFDDVKAKLPQTEAGQVVGGQSPVSALVERMQALRDKPMTLQAVQEVDEALGRLIDKEYGVKGISKDGLQLQEVQHSFRNMIDAAGPGDITGGSAGFDALSTARKAWSQAMKMDDLERIQARASMTDNPATSIKTQLRTLLNNRSRVRGYDAEEIAALKAAAERGTLGSVLHVFGNRLVPLAAGAAEMGTHGLTAGLAAAGASHLVGGKLRSWASTLQENRLRNAMDVLGTKVPENPLNLPPTP